MDDEYQPDMPPVEAGAHIISYLWELGPTMTAGGYPGPVTHEEIMAWQSLNGIELAPWEVRFLRRLSNEYLSQCHKAEKQHCRPPWKSLKALVEGD